MAYKAIVVRPGVPGVPQVPQASSDNEHVFRSVLLWRRRRQLCRPQQRHGLEQRFREPQDSRGARVARTVGAKGSNLWRFGTSTKIVVATIGHIACCDEKNTGRRISCNATCMGEPMLRPGNWT